MTDPSTQRDASILERNLEAIKVRSPRAAAQIREAHASTQIRFETAPTGDLVGIMDGRALCSKRDPMREATTWAQQYDPQLCGFLGVMGFALGHHLRALNSAHQSSSVILCFEPDLALLRAVLERVDHSDWIGSSMFLLTTDPGDASLITGLIHNAEAFITIGVELAPHPPSQRRLEGTSGVFSSTLLGVIRTTRTHLVTVLAHSGITLRNILMNAGVYATSPGLTPLRDSCDGRTAILIAAGPSLSRNLALLEDPTVRERCVIIAVQTMLKPLLERGIKPHFVTALDHHEISKRFYEGLTQEDVRGVRLVVEPKANPAIVDAFPGEILCAREKELDLLLGDELKRDMGTLPAGATVAHLNYYLARYLGCTSVILIGQDLGFTDGQYYASGASIHSVWSGELSEHRSLEMFEWERIARMKSLLRVKEDIHGRRIFTDEQMSTYIAQFEKDFCEDLDANPDIRIINATEGGVRIQHTEVLALKDALEQCLDTTPIAIPDSSSSVIHDEQRDHKVRTRMELVIRQLRSIERNSQRTIEIIEKAQNDINNPAHVDRCITQIEPIRRDVMASEPGFGLVNFINQKGGLERFKVDRQIKLLPDLSGVELQAKQLERDAKNVRVIEGSAVQARKLMERSLAVFNGSATPMTRDEFADDSVIESDPQIVEARDRRVEAVIFADPRMGPLGTARDLGKPIHQGLNALELTIKRLGRCHRLDGITVITPDPEQISAMHLNADSTPVRVVACDPERFSARTRSVGQARIASGDCWRGSLGSFGCYDESLDPVTLERVLSEHHIDACAVIGSDWAMVDPQLVDQIVSRHRADPEHCRIPFSQAVPGLGCCVLDSAAAKTLAKASQSASVLASIGAMLGYIPVGPQGDPIASPLCVGVDPAIRDAGVRVVADSDMRRDAMSRAYAGLGDFAMAASTQVLLRAYIHELQLRQDTAPSRIVLELSTQRNASGLWGAMHEQPNVHELIPMGSAIDLISEAHALNGGCTLLLHGRGDPLTHPEALSIIAHAEAAGMAGIEVRTDLINQPFTPRQLMDSGMGVLSVDILADNATSYERMTGTNSYDLILDRMQALFNSRTSVASQLPLPWILPRITRCDAVYDDIQSFYDRWLTVCGCAMIDAPPIGMPGRIQQIEIPKRRASQLHHNSLRIHASGQVVDHNAQPIGTINAIELGIEEAYRQMRLELGNATHADIEAKSVLTPVHQS